MFRDFYQKHKNIFQYLDGLFINNTVLTYGLAIAWVVVVGNVLEKAIAVSIAFSVVTFVTVFITSFIPNSIPYAIRIMINTMIGALVYIPVDFVLREKFPISVYSIGVFLPLIITNSLITKKSGYAFHTMPRKKMLWTLSFHILGFDMVICIVAAVREYIGNSTLLGRQLWHDITVPGLMYPVGGFVLCGFLAALLKYIKQKLTGFEEE